MELRKIASFTVNHEDLEPGVYVSRVDRIGAEAVTTFDLRMTAPNREPVMDTAAVHAIEHLGATYLRNDPAWRDQVVYFGPMGCRTGFYLLTLRLCFEEVLALLKESIKKALALEEVPGSKREECGNYLEHDLAAAKEELRNYLLILDGVEAHS